MATIYFQDHDGNKSTEAHFNGGSILVSPSASGVAAYFVKRFRAILMHQPDNDFVPIWLLIELTTQLQVYQSVHEGNPCGTFTIYLPKSAVKDDAEAAKLMRDLASCIFGDSSFAASWPSKYHCGYSVRHHRPLTEEERRFRTDKQWCVEDRRYLSVSLSPFTIMVM